MKYILIGRDKYLGIESDSPVVPGIILIEWKSWSVGKNKKNKKGD